MDIFGFLTIAGFAFLGASTSECPDAWMYYRGSCYLFSHEKKTFTEAEHFCLHHQSHLVKIDNSDEDNFIKSHCRDLQTAYRWIGLTDADIEGVWQNTDGTPAEYTNWYPGEPGGGKAEDCAVLYHNYDWSDLTCAATAMIICEKAISQTPCQPDGGLVVG